MAKIYIEPAKARATLSQQMALERTLQALSQDVGGIRNGLNYKISGREAIDARLRDAINRLNKEADSTRALRTGLEQIIVRYEQAENSNTDRVAAEKTSVQTAGGASSIVVGPVPGTAVGLKEGLKEWLKSERAQELIRVLLRLGQTASPAAWYWGLLQSISSTFSLESSANGITSKISGGIGYEEDETKVKFGTYKNKLAAIDNDAAGSKFYWDPKTNKVTGVNPDDEKANKAFSKHNKGLPVDVKLASVGASRSISALALDTELEKEYVGLSTKTRVGELKGELGGYIGLLGAGGTVGTSFTAFSTEAKGYLGTDDLQVYGKAGVTAGKVEAKGSFDVGLVDKDGKFNPALQAGASAEAIAGEISGTVGGKVAGADVSVTGKLNYGVGAHANVGYKDGKLSVDIGATLGVGGSVKLDIDLSGTVNAVADTAQNVWSGVKSFFKW